MSEPADVPRRDGVAPAPDDAIVPVERPGASWDDVARLRACLAEPVPRIPPVYGYDQLGSRLFEAITRLPTYYLTRVEWDLLRRHADEIAERLAATNVAELGSGSAKKTRVLLAACLAHRATRYLPIDVSHDMLQLSASALRAELPALAVTPLFGQYEAGLAWLRDHVAGPAGDEPLAVAFLGSNLGNTTAEERTALLAEIGRTLRPGDGFLFSADLRKPAAVFERCYNDPPGHSAFAEFRLNHLTHVNRRFGADFVPRRYHPRAHYNEAGQVVEGHLYPVADQLVTIRELGLTLELTPDQSINVGFSAKFNEDGLLAEVERHGMVAADQWVDPDWRYGIFLVRKK